MKPFELLLPGYPFDIFGSAVRQKKAGMPRGKRGTRVTFISSMVRPLYQKIYSHSGG